MPDPKKTLAELADIANYHHHMAVESVRAIGAETLGQLTDEELETMGRKAGLRAGCAGVVRDMLEALIEAGDDADREGGES